MTNIFATEFSECSENIEGKLNCAVLWGILHCNGELSDFLTSCGTAHYL